MRAINKAAMAGAIAAVALTTFGGTGATASAVASLYYLGLLDNPRPSDLALRQDSAGRTLPMETVIARADVQLPLDAIAFQSPATYCNFYGKMQYSEPVHAWFLFITRQECAGKLQKVRGEIVPKHTPTFDRDGTPHMRAGDEAFLEWLPDNLMF